MTPRHATQLLCALGIALGALNPAVAWAQDDATVEMARQRFREGVQFYDQRQYDKARLAFLQAYTLKPHPSVLLNLAQSELRGSRPEDAAGHFNEYLRTNAEASEAEKQEAELGLAAAKSKIGEVTLNVDVPGAAVAVDGADRGVAPLPGPLYVAPGAHTLEARSGDKRATKAITVSPGQSVSLSLSLRGAAVAAAPAATPKDEGDDEEATPPGDGEEPEATPPDEEAEPEAAEASTSGRKPFFTWLFSSPVGIAGTAVGGAGLVTGVVTAVLASQQYADANSTQNTILGVWLAGDRALVTKQLGRDVGPCDPAKDPGLANVFASALGAARAGDYVRNCKNYQDHADSGDTMKTVSIIGTSIGAVAIVGTVVYYFIDPKAKEGAALPSSGFRARVLPWTQPGLGGLSVIGQF